MGFTLHREVRAFLTSPRSRVDGKGVSKLERLIALQIASEADETTRNCRRYDKRLGRSVPTVTVELLAEWLEASEQAISVGLRQLSQRGLEFRRVLRKDANGAPMYAYKGRATEFWVPPLPTVRDE